MVFVQPTDGDSFLRALELPMRHAVFAAVAGSQGQTAITPQLPLGPEPVWRLNERAVGQRESVQTKGLVATAWWHYVFCSRPVTRVALAGVCLESFAKKVLRHFGVSTKCRMSCQADSQIPVL